MLIQLQIILPKVGEASNINQSLGTFMVMAAIVIIMIGLIFGIAYESLEKKNNHHEEMLKTEHQIKFK